MRGPVRNDMHLPYSWLITNWELVNICKLDFETRLFEVYRYANLWTLKIFNCVARLWKHLSEDFSILHLRLLKMSRQHAYRPCSLHLPPKINNRPRPKQIVHPNLPHIEITSHELPLLHPPLQAVHHRRQHLPRRRDRHMQHQIYVFRGVMEVFWKLEVARSDVDGGVAFGGLEEVDG